MGVWQFFQDEILGMKWLNRLIGSGLSLLGLDIDSRLGSSVHFFLYDVIKITVLLCYVFLAKFLGWYVTGRQFCLPVITFMQRYLPLHLRHKCRTLR